MQSEKGLCGIRRVNEYRSNNKKNMRMKQYKRTIMMMTMLILLAIAFVPIIWLKVEREQTIIKIIHQKKWLDG